MRDWGCDHRPALAAGLEQRRQPVHDSTTGLQVERASERVRADVSAGQFQPVAGTGSRVEATVLPLPMSASPKKQT
jgi:hypothetical protein